MVPVPPVAAPALAPTAQRAGGRVHALALAILGMTAIVVATVLGWWVLLPDIAPKRIVLAVLPFDDSPAGAAGDVRWLGDGIAEDVRIALAQTPEFVVLAGAAALAYRDHQRRLATLRDETGATHAVQGGAHHAGGRLRVAARLIDLAEGQALWEADWDAPMADLFSIRDAIAQGVAAKLLLLGESRATAGPAVAGDAYEAFLRGRLLAAQGDLAGTERLLRGALGRDPHNPYAHAWLARRLAGQDADAALDHARTALSQAPGFPPALAVAAWLDFHVDGDAARLFDSLWALVAERRDVAAMRWLAELYAAGGHPADAELLRRHLSRLDPAGAAREGPGPVGLGAAPSRAALGKVAWLPAADLFAAPP